MKISPLSLTALLLPLIFVPLRPMGGNYGTYAQKIAGFASRYSALSRAIFAHKLKPTASLLSRLPKAQPVKFSAISQPCAQITPAKKLPLSAFAAARSLARPALHVETFFYKINGEPITEQEHDVLYDIKLRKQFPTCLEYGDGTMPDDEVAAIQEELDQKLPGIKVIYIPTVVYERLFLSTYTKDMMCDGFRETPRNNFSHLYPIFKETARAAHLHFNNSAIAQIDIQDISGWTNQYLLHENDIIQKAAHLEREAYKKGNFLIWRATDTVEKKSHGNQSLSFGHTLHGGHYFAGPGACVIDRLTRKNFAYDYGYCVPLNKKEFTSKSSPLNNKFYIPPLTTIEGLAGDLELFHPRTKYKPHMQLTSGGCDATPRLFEEGSIFMSPDERAMFNEFVKENLMISCNNSEQCEKVHTEIFQYITENRIVFKTRDTRPWCPLP